MNWRTAVSLLSILLFPVVLGISVVVWLAPPIEVLDEVRLVPNDRRQVVALDRPHNPDPSFHPGAPPPPSVKRTRTFQVRTNSIGLRGPELANPKRLPRLLCVGDSGVFGWGLEYDETWCVKLARMRRMEPVIGAWPAAAPDSSMRWIRENAVALQADIVVVAWAPDADNWTFARNLWNFRSTKRALGDIRLGWIVPPSGTFDPVGAKAAETLYPQLKDRSPDGVPVLNLTPLFRQRLPLPGVIGDLSEERHRLIRLPDQAVLVDVPAPPLHPEYGTMLAQEIIDAFEADPNMREPLFTDPGHPDEVGTTVYAQEVSAWFDTLGW